MQIEKLKRKIQSNSFGLEYSYWMPLKRIQKIIPQRLLNRRIKKPRLKFKLGLALIGLRITRPWSTASYKTSLNQQTARKSQKRSCTHSVSLASLDLRRKLDCSIIVNFRATKRHCYLVDHR